MSVSTEDFDAQSRSGRRRDLRRNARRLLGFASLTASMVMVASIGVVATASAAGTAPAACHAGQIHLTAGRGGAAAGSYEQAFIARNVSQRTCTVKGHPRIRFATASGKNLKTRAKYGSDSTFPQGKNTTIILAPGAAASFKMAPPPTGARSCVTRDAAVKATIHGDTRAAMTEHAVFPYCGGKVTVSNFVKGTRGPQF